MKLENIQDASTEGWETKRFILTFKAEDKEKVFKGDFWPQRIYFKQWFMRKEAAAGGFRKQDKNGQ